MRRARALARAVSQHWPQLHGRLLVLPLNHLVVLPVLQVGGQLRVLSLLCPLPGSVALEEGGAVTRLRVGEGGRAGLGQPHPSWLRFLKVGEQLKSPEGAALPRLPSHRAQVWESVDGAFVDSLPTLWISSPAGLSS